MCSEDVFEKMYTKMCLKKCTVYVQVRNITYLKNITKKITNRRWIPSFTWNRPLPFYRTTSTRHGIEQQTYNSMKGISWVYWQGHLQRFYAFKSSAVYSKKFRVAQTTYLTEDGIPEQYISGKWDMSLYPSFHVIYIYHRVVIRTFSLCFISAFGQDTKR